MDGKEEINSGVTVKGDETTESYRVASRAENPSHSSGGPTMAAMPPVSMAVPAMEVRKKRGRPRKYGPDGAVAAALSPMPISASIPLTGDFSGWKHAARVRPFQTIKKAHKLEFENLGDRLAYLVGANFTPHVITVHAGEDVALKIHSFSQQESRAICVLSASGSISNVTLRQPNSSGGTMTYEGRFEILSLSGSFMPTDNGIVKSRSGGMSVSLASPDGRVLGGGLAGLLIAASPVQVVLGSFLPGHQQEQKPKKNRVDASAAPIIPATVTPINRESMDGGYGGQKMDFTSPPQLQPDSMGSLNPTPDNNVSSPEGESNDDSQ
ncbi:AT-hook motif nuclear-localized protein 1 [Ancistrocladus abbreviatus]